MLDDEKNIIQAAKKGDAQAFGSLYEHYSKAIYRFIVVKVSSRHEAEDLLHDVFLSAWEKLPSFKLKGFPFSSWLYRIARNRVIDHYRVKKSHVNIDDMVGHLEEEFLRVGAIQRQELNLKLDLERVLTALEELTEDQREVIEMRFFQDLAPKEIAQILKKKEGTVRILQHRGTQKLKQILDNKEDKEDDRE